MLYTITVSALAVLAVALAPVVVRPQFRHQKQKKSHNVVIQSLQTKQVAFSLVQSPITNNHIYEFSTSSLIIIWHIIIYLLLVCIMFLLIR
jgi:hypothetical protein